MIRGWGNKFGGWKNKMAADEAAGTVKTGKGPRTVTLTLIRR